MSVGLAGVYKNIKSPYTLQKNKKSKNKEEYIYLYDIGIILNNINKN
jgi:hypothetical protein